LTAAFHQGKWHATGRYNYHGTKIMTFKQGYEDNKK